MRSFVERSRVLCVFIVLALLGFISSCGGSGGGGGAPTGNLTLASLNVVDSIGARTSPLAGPDILFIGHPFNVRLEINSEYSVEDVSVNFYIVERNAFDAGADPEDDTLVDMGVNEYHVGAVSVGDLAAGMNIKMAELILPYVSDDMDDAVKPLAPDLEYYLFAELDPADLIKETDEEDNRPMADTLGQTMVSVWVEDTYMDIPNLMLESLLLEVPAFEVLTAVQEQKKEDSCGNAIVPPPAENNHQNAHIGVTAVLNASGRYVLEGAPAPIPLVKIIATLKFPGLEIPDLPVSFFMENEYYSNELLVYDLEPGIPTSVSLELRLSESVVPLDLLVEKLIEKTSICASSCYLDRECYVAEMMTPGGSCDIEDLELCGGSIVPSDPPLIVDPDWRCFLEKADSACINACEPDLTCIYECSEEFVTLDVQVSAFELNPGGWYEGIVTPPEFLVDDNLQVQLVMLPTPTPKPTAPVMFEAGFDRSFSTKFLYTGLGANTWARLDEGGATAGLEAALPLVLFRSNPTECNPDVGDECLLGYKSGDVALGVEYTLSATPKNLMGDSFNDLGIYAFGSNIYANYLDFRCDYLNVDELSQWKLGGFSDCAINCDKKDTECIRDCGAFGKTRKFERDFVVGVVPLTSSFEAWALIGAMATLDLPDACSEEDFLFEAKAGPWADMGSSLTAGVGNRLFSIGIGGALDPLFRDEFYATVAMNDLNFDLNNGAISGTLHEDVTNTLTGPVGKLFFYLGYPCIKICRKWGIPYPCGFKTCKKKKTFASFETFEIEDVLLCEEQYFNSGPLYVSEQQ